MYANKLVVALYSVEAF